VAHQVVQVALAVAVVVLVVCAAQLRELVEVAV
jgi:hypothetical protein